MSEPRYASEDWRWIDEEDGHHVLLAGRDLMPVPRIVLACGNIDAEDQDLIKAAPAMRRALDAILARYQELYEDMDVEYAAFFTAMWREVEQCRAALAAVRGEGQPDE